MRFPGVPLPGTVPVHTRGRFKGQPKQFAGMEMVTELHCKWDPEKALQQRHMNKIVRETNKRVLKYWHNKLLPRHFMPGNTTEYRYEKRTVATQIQKIKRTGRAIAIVDKGLAKNVSQIVRALRATPTTGRIVMMGPWYMGVRVERQKGGLSPDLKAEATTISPRDARMMAKYGSAQMKTIYLDLKRQGFGRKKVKIT